MTIDPYSLCLCGSGKKVKWCCGKIMPQLERFFSLLESEQRDGAFRALDKLEQENARPALVGTLRAQALSKFGNASQAREVLDQVIEEYPRFGLAHQVRAGFQLVAQEFAEALDGYRTALACFPPEAVDQLVRTCGQIGACHALQGRPLAAWAAWQQALRLDPGNGTIQKTLEETIKSNHMLPQAARHGLGLKSPDPLSVFNDERRGKWDEALRRHGDWQLADLVGLFEQLAEDDQYDAAAWYNLALAHAWSGDNARAIEAMSRYAALEDDFEAAANAWDLSEVLRLGVGAEAYSDNRLFVLTYGLSDAQGFIEALRATGRVLVLRSTDGKYLMHWMDAQLPEESAPVPLLGGPRRQLAQIHLLSETEVEVIATTGENLQMVQSELDRVVAGTARPTRLEERPGSVHNIDAEPLLFVTLKKDLEGQDQQAHLLRAVQHYFEEDWVRRPLRALDGVAPLDAAGGGVLKKKLEGVLRFRERNFEKYRVPYDFDRLRIKLGLQTSGPAGRPDDLAARSAAQLAELAPPGLSDDDLVVAYRTANNLDVPETARRFAEEIVRRGSLAASFDVIAVFRRLVVDVLRSGRPADAAAFVEAGFGYDQKHYSGAHGNELEALRARALLANEQSESAGDLFRKLFDEEPENLGLVADAVEGFLSAGIYHTAREFAERGLKQAEALRLGEYQGQFREYLEVARSGA